MCWQVSVADASRRSVWLWPMYANVCVICQLFVVFFLCTRAKSIQEHKSSHIIQLSPIELYVLRPSHRHTSSLASLLLLFAYYKITVARNFAIALAWAWQCQCGMSGSIFVQRFPPNSHRRKSTHRWALFARKHHAQFSCLNFVLCRLPTADTHKHIAMHRQNRTQRQALALLCFYLFFFLSASASAFSSHFIHFEYPPDLFLLSWIIFTIFT